MYMSLENYLNKYCYCYDRYVYEDSEDTLLGA